VSHRYRPAGVRILTLLLVLAPAWLASCAGDDASTSPTVAPVTPTATATPFDPAGVDLSIAAALTGLTEPVFVTHAGDGSGRLFVVERAGVIRVARDGALLEQPYLDIVDLVESEGTEQGLLGLAFHPDFASNGLFYVAYTAAAGGANTIARFHAAPDGDQADRDSRLELLAIPDDRPNHNGGMLTFGPDGYLYAGTGDGGFGRSANGQRRDVLLGKLLRLDVDGGDPYGIPPDNPFVDDSDVRPEIWAYGLRNPWRFAFDPATNDLYIADVGASDYEEINVQPAASDGGENYGWDITEGRHCRADAPCEPTDFTLPVAEYDHDDGCSVTGGYVYRGADFPALRGAYLFADYCDGTIWSLHRDAGGDWVVTTLLETDLFISSFGEDEAGELYLTAMDEGVVYRVVVR
jgi:glucose/arabinose dehydrogenase